MTAAMQSCAELAVRLARIYPKTPAHVVAEAADALTRAGRRAHVLAELRCERPITEGDLESRRASIIAAARRALNRVREGNSDVRDVGIELSGDPRGHCLRLFHADLGGNSAFGGKEAGYGV